MKTFKTVVLVSGFSSAAFCCAGFWHLADENTHQQVPAVIMALLMGVSMIVFGSLLVSDLNAKVGK